VNKKIFRCSERAASELRAAILADVTIRAPWCADNGGQWKISSQGRVGALSPDCSPHLLPRGRSKCPRRSSPPFVAVPRAYACYRVARHHRGQPVYRLGLYLIEHHGSCAPMTHLCSDRKFIPSQIHETFEWSSVCSASLLWTSRTNPRPWLGTVDREFGFSPKSAKIAAVGISPWPAIHKLIHTSLLCVLASFESPVACRLDWLN
jgi:hypothetical protein